MMKENLVMETVKELYVPCNSASCLQVWDLHLASMCLLNDSLSVQNIKCQMDDRSDGSLPYSAPCFVIKITKWRSHVAGISV